MVETALYLIPVQLSECDLTSVLPARNLALVCELRHYIVENVRTARRFLKKCDRNIDIDSLTFYELNRHTAPEAIAGYLAPLEAGEPMGVLSEAGCPAIADPGADVVAIAQRKGLKVVPLVGPSSILMGLMGSGFNGQSFAFRGYLPIEANARAKMLEKMTHRIMHEDETQIFIETPYRNNALVAELARKLPSKLKLCIASDITGTQERIETRNVREWQQVKTDFNKIPTLFLLYK
jgi:16S rRNA (cytidine1402-2'-O)-methyltransferase